MFAPIKIIRPQRHIKKNRNVGNFHVPRVLLRARGYMAQKSLDFQGPPLPMALVMDLQPTTGGGGRHEVYLLRSADHHPRHTLSIHLSISMGLISEQQVADAVPSLVSKFCCILQKVILECSHIVA